MKLQTEHAKERVDILGIMARAEHEFQENEADAKHEYSSVRDDVKTKVKELNLRAEFGGETCFTYSIGRYC